MFCIRLVHVSRRAWIDVCHVDGTLAEARGAALSCSMQRAFKGDEVLVIDTGTGEVVTRFGSPFDDVVLAAAFSNELRRL